MSDKSWWELIVEFIKGLLTKPDDEDDDDNGLKDPFDIMTVKIAGLQVDVRAWAISHAATVKHYGVGKVTIVTDALKEWAKAGQDVSGCCSFVIKRDDGGNGVFYDYIRPNQSGVGRDVPERPKHPLPGHGDYPTFDSKDEVYILVSGLARDSRRNVSLRCPMVPLDPATANVLVESMKPMESIESMKPETEDSSLPAFMDEATYADVVAEWEASIRILSLLD